MNKIRTFEKIKSKRASRKSKIPEININWSDKEVDKFLNKRYSFGLWEFILSLHMVNFFYKLRDAKNKIKALQGKIDRYQTATRKLIENIDKFLTDTDIWERYKKSTSGGDIKLTTDKRRKFITNNFGLTPFFETIKEQIKKNIKTIKFLEIIGYREEKIRISSLNLIILLWSYAMQKRKKEISTELNENDIDFDNIHTLIRWFCLQDNWKNFLKPGHLISVNTPRLTFNKYIKYAKKDWYKELAFSLYIECFEVNIEELKELFPNPSDYVKIQADAMQLVTKKQVEEMVKFRN